MPRGLLAAHAGSSTLSELQLLQSEGIGDEQDLLRGWAARMRGWANGGVRRAMAAGRLRAVGGGGAGKGVRQGGVPLVHGVYGSSRG